jgi:hypothetical protein
MGFETSSLHSFGSWVCQLFGVDSDQRSSEDGKIHHGIGSVLLWTLHQKQMGRRFDPLYMKEPPPLNTSMFLQCLLPLPSNRAFFLVSATLGMPVDEGERDVDFNSRVTVMNAGATATKQSCGIFYLSHELPIFFFAAAHYAIQVNKALQDELKAFVTQGILKALDYTSQR